MPERLAKLDCVDRDEDTYKEYSMWTDGFSSRLDLYPSCLVDAIRYRGTGRVERYCHAVYRGIFPKVGILVSADDGEGSEVLESIFDLVGVSEYCIR